MNITLILKLRKIKLTLFLVKFWVNIVKSRDDKEKDKSDIIVKLFDFC